MFLHEKLDEAIAALNSVPKKKLENMLPSERKSTIIKASEVVDIMRQWLTLYLSSLSVVVSLMCFAFLYGIPAEWLADWSMIFVMSWNAVMCIWFIVKIPFALKVYAAMSMAKQIVYRLKGVK